MELKDNNEEIMDDVSVDTQDNTEEADVTAQDADVTDENDSQQSESADNETDDDSSDGKDKKDELIASLNEQIVRNMAEFDNYRKRTEKEKSAMFEVGAKSVVEKILPVIDNLERGFAAATDEEKESPFYQGIDKIYKQLLTSLEEAGVKTIEAVGQPFDPDYHNAVMHVEDESFGENTVAEEFQKGYMYRDSVVRHSMVKVAN